MISNYKIAVCGSLSESAFTVLSSLGYCCIKTAADKVSLMTSVLMDAPRAIVADINDFGSEELSQLLTMLEASAVKPVFIAIGSTGRELLKKYSRTYYFRRTPDAAQLEYCIERDSDEPSKKFEPDKIQSAYMEFERIVTEIIVNFGISANVKGYRYLRCGVMLAAQDMTILDSVTKRLYPAIAVSNNTTPSRVERAIRHAIASAWDKGGGDVDFIESKLRCRINYAGERPTNSEFIALISDSLRLSSYI